MKSPNHKGNGNGKAPLKGSKGVAGPPAGRDAHGVKKVARLGQAVRSGTYRVEARKVADKIVMDAVREIRTRPQ